MVISESYIYRVSCVCWELPDAKSTRTSETRFWPSRGCSQTMRVLSRNINEKGIGYRVCPGAALICLMGADEGVLLLHTGHARCGKAGGDKLTSRQLQRG